MVKWGVLVLLSLLGALFLLEIFYKSSKASKEYRRQKELVEYQVMKRKYKIIRDNIEDLTRTTSGGSSDSHKERLSKENQEARKTKASLSDLATRLRIFELESEYAIKIVYDRRYYFWRVFLIVLLILLGAMTFTALAQVSERKRTDYPAVIEGLKLELTPLFETPGTFVLKARYKFHVTSVHAESRTEHVTIAMRYLSDDNLNFDGISINPKSKNTAIDTEPVMREYEFRIASGHKKKISRSEMKFLMTNKLPLDSLKSSRKTERSYTTLIVNVPYEEYSYADSSFLPGQHYGVCYSPVPLRLS